ncbi:hypothetical protein CRE_17537 [Caenorhabditis remanei]|uniref:Mos1 transposase HTH domain-containing protein n=1 Tax=Caenorhabditis remanei TaxID=31234 RepID=E3NC05_CAERE|nr:hypothetical protein CRE_17537 [Caenorhabditis remanei]
MAEVLAKDRNALKRCFLLGYLPGLSAKETYRNLRETIGEDIISYKTATTWFKNFKEEDYNLDDKCRSDRPRLHSYSLTRLLDTDDDVSDVLEDESRLSAREVSSHTGPSFATIYRHQKESGRTAKYEQVISHELTDSQLKLSCDLSQSLLSRKRSFDWILDIATGNKKWALYVNHSVKSKSDAISLVGPQRGLLQRISSGLCYNYRRPLLSITPKNNPIQSFISPGNRSFSFVA